MDPVSTPLESLSTIAAAAKVTAEAALPSPEAFELSTTLFTQLLFYGIKIHPLLPTYAHLLATALLPIYASAHASLTRPNNVQGLKPKSKRETSKVGGQEDLDQGEDRLHEDEGEQNEEEDEDEDEDKPVENLTARDAFLFPITAGVMLGFLYVIIKYMQDPTLLSRILTYYFVFMGSAAVAAFYSDLLGVFLSFIFPRSWRYSPKKGEDGYYVAGHDCYYFHSSPSGRKIPDKESLSPFPRNFVPVPKSLYKPLWSLRRKLLSKYAIVIKLGSYSPSSKPIRKTFTLTSILGVFLSLITICLYLQTSKHWIFTNIMGISFAYSAMRLISPTTFPIATLLLSLLFFYDIYFVFYTPLMITVATNLDIPIKLLFPRPSPVGISEESGKGALAMLGLGDVVLPGMMIGLALRFDFWRWNESRKKFIRKPGSSEPDTVVLPKYIKPTGTWGERFWNRTCCPSKNERNHDIDQPTSTTTYTIGGNFPKPYFYSSLIGYILGMIVTLLVMHIFNHAQPALLYLVPGVVGAVWLMGVVKGELNMMWHYSEEEEEQNQEAEAEGEAREREKKEGVQGRKEDKGDRRVEKKSKDQKREHGDEGIPADFGGQKEQDQRDKKKTPAREEGDRTPPSPIESTSSKLTSEPEMVIHHPDSESDAEVVDEHGETEYISVSLVKKPAFGARKRLRTKIGEKPEEKAELQEVGDSKAKE